jgi:hypothetical protein
MANGWIETKSGIGVPAYNPVQAQCVHFSTVDNSYKKYGTTSLTLIPPNVFDTIDCTQLYVPNDVVAVDIVGILIITPGTTSNDPDLALSFQGPGQGITDMSVAYMAQVINASRTNFALTVPCVNARFEWGYIRGEYADNSWPAGPIPAYPSGAAYGASISVAKYFRP